MSSTQPILVIDDDEDIRNIVAMMLDAVGYRVEKAVDGVHALERLADGMMPALILLDMMMPRMDGEQFLTALRADPRFAAIPVVLLSGHNEARAKARSLDVAGCLVKPVDIDDLVAAVAAFAPVAPRASPGATPDDLARR